MPQLNGRFVPVLRVNDAVRSSEWYARVLAVVEVDRYTGRYGWVEQVTLTDPSTGLLLCLVADGIERAPFDEHSVGLDHLEFLVDDERELESWAVHLDAMEVSHSGLKRPDYSRAAILTFRDPDNIQIELFVSRR